MFNIFYFLVTNQNDNFYNLVDFKHIDTKKKMNYNCNIEESHDG